MHRFQPTRASPPVKSSVLSNSTRTNNSVVLAPELQNLTPEDIDILDAVIQRAGPSSTTFPKIFKAYSDVFKERGMDPEEVVYYGKLLKLGTLRGKDWGEKWETVKAAGYTPTTPTLQTFQSESEFPHAPSEFSELSYEAPPQRRFPPRQAQATSWAPTRNKPVTKPETVLPPARRPTIERDKTDVPQQQRRKPDAKDFSSISTAFLASKPGLDAESTVASEDLGSISVIPPSYKSTAIPRPLTRAAPLRPATALPLHMGQKIPHIPKDLRKPIDAEDPWKKIRMEQDEKFADKFREETLIHHCWNVWLQGLAWIKTTHQQIDEARDKHILGVFLQRWRDSLVSRKAIGDNLVDQFQRRNLKPFFKLWQARLKQRRQTAWRNDMRQRMKLIKNKQDNKLKKDAWTKWRRLRQLLQADKHYEVSLQTRYHARWIKRLVELDNKAVIAENFSKGVDQEILRRLWDSWRRSTSLRRDENIIAQRVDDRIMTTAYDTWRKRFVLTQVSDGFRDTMIQKHAIEKWKKSMTTISALDVRADRHVARQDALLLRAVFRIWRARMRGSKFEKFRPLQIMATAMQKWKTRMAQHSSQMDAAVVQYNRSNPRVMASALSHWQRVLATHQNAHAYAVTYDKDRLLAKSLLLWRLRLGENMQSAKVARWANKFFATRRSWNIWIAAMEERKRQKQLKLWNLSKVSKFFNVWHRRTMQARYLRETEDLVRSRLEKRVKFVALVHWTNRVIELKSRELDVGHRFDMSLQKAAFQRWKFRQRKHMEDLSLLENYMLVRQEDILRRAFTRWLTAKRSNELRRQAHQRKEAQLRTAIITSAWEKWRERFQEERLRPLEYTVIIDNQKNVMSTAFRIWLSKTNSLPAVKFHSKHLKEKFFARWKGALPNALRAKKAQETDKINTLAKFFEMWAQAYKTKTTLKAVARAKNLRLPTVTSRQPITRSRPIYSGPRDIFPRRPMRDTTEDTESQTSDTRIEPLREAYRPRSTATSRPGKSPRARSERSLVRSDYGASVFDRQPSPVRSIASMPDRRQTRSPSFANVYVSPAPREGGGKLWAALKDIGPTRPRRPTRNL